MNLDIFKFLPKLTKETSKLNRQSNACHYCHSISCSFDFSSKRMRPHWSWIQLFRRIEWNVNWPGPSRTKWERVNIYSRVYAHYQSLSILQLYFKIKIKSNKVEKESLNLNKRHLLGPNDWECPVDAHANKYETRRVRE